MASVGNFWKTVKILASAGLLCAGTVFFLRSETALREFERYAGAQKATPTPEPLGQPYTTGSKEPSTRDVGNDAAHTVPETNSSSGTASDPNPANAVNSYPSASTRSRLTFLREDLRSDVDNLSRERSNLLSRPKEKAVTQATVSAVSAILQRTLQRIAILVDVDREMAIREEDLEQRSSFLEQRSSKSRSDANPLTRSIASSPLTVAPIGPSAPSSQVQPPKINDPFKIDWSLVFGILAFVVSFIVMWFGDNLVDRFSGKPQGPITVPTAYKAAEQHGDAVEEYEHAQNVHPGTR